MYLKLTNIAHEVIDEYKLMDITPNGYVYIEIRKGMYGLPQAGLIVQGLLEKGLPKINTIMTILYLAIGTMNGALFNSLLL